MMLAQVDPETFALNMFLIIGVVVFLVLVFVITVICWTGIKMRLSELRERRSWAEYKEQSRRADGEPYPPYTEGLCEECGRGDKMIYHPQDGPALCPNCYEEYWRSENG